MLLKFIFDFKTAIRYSIFVAAPPVLLDGDRVVAARLGHVTLISQKIYSVSPVNVTLERQMTPLITTRINLTTTDVKHTRVALNVFNSVVEADGVTVVLSFNISSQDEFGKYQIVVANNVMPAARRAFEIVPEGITFYTYIAIMLELIVW